MSYKSTETLIEELIEQLDEDGISHDRQGEHGIKIEQGEDDDDAPEVVQHGSSGVPTCCKLGGDGNMRRGINLTLTVGVTDRLSGADSSGVKRVSAVPIKPDGSTNIGMFFAPWTRWKLSAEEQAVTREGSSSHKFTGCIPCSHFHDRTVRFRVLTEDAENNVSIQFIGVTVGQLQFDECCSSN